MADFELDLSGFASLQDEFEDLKDGWEDSPVYKVGSNAEYAAILEFGRGPIRADEGYLRFEVDGEVIYRKEVSGHPPYPWFRPAIRAFRARPKGFITDNTDFNSIQEIPDVDTLVLAIATALENQMTKNVSANSASDRSSGTVSDHPVRQSGNLAASISFTKVG
mgnify:CR=1 FL=1